VNGSSPALLIRVIVIAPISPPAARQQKGSYVRQVFPSGKSSVVEAISSHESE